MSLIGPRPDPLDDMEVYTEHQKKKLAVRPGITGYNQAYYRNSVEQNEKFEHDVYYAENISFLLDVKIFFKTIATIFARDGAHIFHTNNTKVWNYITQFATFNRFTNSPVANYKERCNCSK